MSDRSRTGLSPWQSYMYILKLHPGLRSPSIRCRRRSLSLFPFALQQCTLITKLFRRISTVSRKIGNHEGPLPLRVSLLFLLPSSYLFFSRSSSFFSFLSPSSLLVTSCSFSSTGGHFLSTRASIDVICARDRYTVLLRREKWRGKKTRGEKRSSRGQRLLMDERASSSRNEKDELKCERARGEWWSIASPEALNSILASGDGRNTYIYMYIPPRFCVAEGFLFYFFLSARISFLRGVILGEKVVVAVGFSDCARDPILPYIGFWRFSRRARLIAALKSVTGEEWRMPGEAAFFCRSSELFWRISQCCACDRSDARRSRDRNRRAARVYSISRQIFGACLHVIGLKRYSAAFWCCHWHKEIRESYLKPRSRRYCNTVIQSC